MKKLLFATALLTALFLSACGSQKADSNDLAHEADFFCGKSSFFIGWEKIDF